MAKLSERQKILAIGGGALGVCLLAGFGVWWVQGMIEETRQQIEAKKTEITAAEQKIARIPATEKEVVILRENLDKYVKILPETKDLNVFAKTLTQFSRQSQIQLEAINPAGNGGGAGSERFQRIEYQCDLKATIWQLLKFMSFIENQQRFVSVTSVSITSGGNHRDEDLRDGEVLHTVKLAMETYTYTGKTSGQDVEIPDYDEKRASLREEIFKRQVNIRMDGFVSRGSQGRRDIFVDPRERIGSDGRGGPSQAEQKGILERLLGELQQVRDGFKRMRQPDTTVFELYSLEKKVREGLTKLEGALESEAQKITFGPLKLRWTKEFAEPVKELRQSLDAVGQGEALKDPFLSKSEFETLLADIEKDLTAGNLDEARQRYELVAGKAAVPESDARHEYAVRAKILHLKAVTALAFRNLDLRINGVLVNHTGRSGVLLNGEVYEEGEYVSDDLLVERVEEEQIRFVFRGLTMIRTL